ncbi:hypothetical protein [Paenisporosarcina quisquiliarum]|uniref:hypothetical protein n=1 Tax=Paenisporosarcina quisquiliarum TaxID=365346 RepID=UPI003736A0A6
MEREISLFMINALWAFVILGVVHLLSILVFSKHKQMISMIHTFLLLLLIHYFIITQREYLFDEYRATAYLTIALVLLGYYIFFRNLKSFIRTRKSERESSSEEY